MTEKSKRLKQLLKVIEDNEKNLTDTERMNYQNLKESYLFYNIAQKTKAYLEAHPGAHLYRMGIGDVSLPLCDAVIQKLHEAVEDQAHKTTFHGYMPECGDTELRTTLRHTIKKEE